MAGPWEKYQSQSSAAPAAESGPWSKYQSNSAPQPIQETPFQLLGRGVMETAGKVTAPLAYGSQLIDPYTGAPIRAAVGELQSGGTLNAAGQKALEQVKAGKVLPGTPSGEDIVLKAETQAGIKPEFAAPVAKVAGPLVGAGLDITNLIPGEAVLRGVEKGAELAGTAGRAASSALNKTGELAAKGVFGVGEKLTGGALNAEKSFAATKSLTPMEQIFPKNTGEPAITNLAASTKTPRDITALDNIAPMSKEDASAVAAAPGGPTYQNAKNISRSLGAYGVMQGNKLATGIGIAAELGNPQVYHKVVGAARLPQAAAEGIISKLDQAYAASGAKGAVQVLQDAAIAHPELAGSIIRTGALVPGRQKSEPGIRIPGGNQ